MGLCGNRTKKLRRFDVELTSLLNQNDKEIKNAPECIVELYKHVEIFKNTREVHFFFSSVLKNSQVLI